MRRRSTLFARIAIGAALCFGGTSLLLFVVFLFSGPFRLIVLDVSTPVALGIDAILCLLFFVQHSGMIRQSFSTWLGRFAPVHLHRAIYATASGVCLLALLVFWQSTAPIVVSVDGFFCWMLRGFFLAAVLGCLWGTRALGWYDAFGIRPIRAFLDGEGLRIS